MTLQEIPCKDLEAFLQSDIYRHAKNLPITPQRALSQLKNPKVEDEDILLTIALDDQQEIVGFIGALPDRLVRCPERRLAWNSCWWVDPVRGKNAAMPLFFKFLSHWDSVMFRELTPHTQQLIDRLNRFKTVRQLHGKRYFSRLDLRHVMVRKKPNLAKYRFVWGAIDGLANGWLRAYRSLRSAFQPTEVYQHTIIDSLDADCEALMMRQAPTMLFDRKKKEMEWIYRHPWIVEKSTDTNKPKQYYYFSDTSPYFRSQLVKLQNAEGQTVAVLLITNNHGLVKIPYAYFESDHLALVCRYITDYMQKEKAVSVITFRPALQEGLEKVAGAFWTQRELHQALVVSHRLAPEMAYDFTFQDGEGDFGFT